MAEKLKGLIDKANAVIGGLLGDFPQGFNIGATAGVPGFAGDMAYMADTAGRALTGRDGINAADYPGTTEYIARQAGYEPPTSLSGQLGMAVGGMLSPTPADLLKFAPVLSAIPFWHGSPHKYDAVDLAHIGSGEGAQAYGWGYYGAESKGVATGYRDSLTPWNQLEYQGSAINGLDDDTRIAVEWVQREIEHGAPDPDWAKAVAAKKLMARGDKSAAAMAAQIDPEQIKLAEGHLYQGEYRWPDPAKEASTPLTEADLLDWDKPLSEQSPQVRKAINDYMTLRGVDSYKTDDGSSVYLGVGAESALTGKDVYRDMWQASRNAAIDSGRNADTTFDAAQRAASEDLNFVGIPGIRYLDQMSRGAGEGTRNYVFFDQEGIKLLERNGEPIKAAEDFASRRAGKAKPYKESLAMDEASRMERAREMGFDTSKTWYHGTQRLDRVLSKPGLDPKRATSGPMPFFTDDPQVASNYATGKTDTSRISEDTDYSTWFKVKAGPGKAKNFDQAWYYLPDDEKAAIKQNIGRIQRNDETGAWEFGEGPAGSAHWEWALKQAYGNPLKAAKDVYLDSGYLFNDEEEFMKVLQMAGLKSPVEYNSPWMQVPGVLPVLARTDNPLNTADKDALNAVLANLEQASKGKRAKYSRGGVDQWDKNTIGIREFTQRLKDDLTNGTTHAFTSIPDVVTEELRKMGYDAIIDKGGKFTGQTHDVLIPFQPNQVRSPNAKFDPSKRDSANLLAGGAAAAVGLGALREYNREKQQEVR